MIIQDVVTRSAIEQVAALAETIWTAYYTPLIGAAQVAYMLARFQNAEAMAGQISEGYHYSAAWTEGTPVGYCATRWEPGECRVFLSKLYVAHNHRRQGIARALLNHHIDALQPNPVKSVWLTVNKHNTASIDAYRRMGFVIFGEQVTDIGQGYVMDDYLMEWILPR